MSASPAKAETPLSEAFYAAMEAIATAIPQCPFPPGINTVEVGKWRLTVNCSGGELPASADCQVNIPPYNVLAEHKECLVIALLGPDEGMIGGGMTEDQFIAEMEAIKREAK